MPAVKEVDAQSGFKVVQQFQLDYAPVNVTQYESTKTGMRCVVVDQAGPKVNGYFALATEIHDDSGAPHTLEHLVFMGSRSWHYKGLLDKLATRAYSTTNAWTATDQTAYTLSTAGWDGFAQILPIYLEHLILPTLTDAGCYTEVHHIDGTGQDAGVVYSEMQGVQNTASSLIYEASKQLLYPEGNGFRYETGGKMEALRVLTAQRIRDFHKAMYQPKNMCLVITGDVDHHDMLRILDEFESTLDGAVPPLDAPFKRPWVDSEPTPALKQTLVNTIEFPEDDESVGEVLISWHGPSCNDDVSSAAMEILLIYLAGSSVSVLENTLVEKEQIASGVVYESEYRPSVVYSFMLTAVETERLKEADQRLHDLLAEVASKPLDLEYMRDCISRFRRQVKIKCEEAGDFFSEAIIVDHLYGDRDGKHLQQMQTMRELDDIEAWSDEAWRAFLTKWLVQNPHITILGTPSAALSKQIKTEEKQRIDERLKQLGDSGLKDLERKLELAKEQNDKPIPDEVLEQFPVPGTESVHFITTVSAGAGLVRRGRNLEDSAIQRIIDKDDKDSPLFLHFEHIPSNFVRLKITMGTDAVPTALKPLIALYLMNFFTTPVTINGKRVEFEELVTRLERDTISYAISTEYGNSEMLAIGVDLEPASYEKVIEWLRVLLFDAVHDADRLHASLTKILADIPDEKRSGRSMLAALRVMLQYSQDSSLRACSTLTKAVYLRRIRKRLEQNPEELLEKFSTVCKAIARPDNFRIKVAANLETLKNPVSAWNRLVVGHSLTDIVPIRRRQEFLSEAGEHPGSFAYIVPIAAIDSSFAVLLSSGISSFTDPDLPALLVAVAYLDAVEGPLWASIRGQGFAYGTWFARSTDPGSLSFNIYRSGNAFKAYSVAKAQVAGLASGAIPLSRHAMEGAVSSIVLEMADEQPTIAHAAEASYVNQVIKGISKDFAHQMLAKVRNIKQDDVRAAINKYMIPVFEPSTSSLIITCSKAMTESLSKEFSEAGFKAEVRTLDTFHDDYGLEAPAGEGDEDDEDEESDEDGDCDDSETIASEDD